MTAFLLNSCRKYEEGPFFSLRTANERLLGVYNISNCSKDGENLTNALNNEFGYTRLSIYEYDYNTRYTFLRIDYNSLYNKDLVFGNYNFDDRDIIKFRQSYDYNYDSTADYNKVLEAFVAGKVNAVIKKLTMKELIFEFEYNHKILRFECQKDMSDAEY
jgi:ABC-type antimicrobial peptide transport system permease subunit